MCVCGKGLGPERGKKTSGRRKERERWSAGGQEGSGEIRKPMKQAGEAI